MSTHIPTSSLSHSDYRQAKSFVDDIKYEIADNTRELIASQTELNAENIRILEDVSSQLRDGFEIISIGLNNISADLRDIGARLDWGFTQITAQLGRANDSIEDLVALAKTPSQTWAYEQFEIAREAFRKALFAEALESIDRAINGFQDHLGYKLEHRFHYLAGVIYFGGTGIPESIKDLNKSELCMIEAAKYAAADVPEDSSIALCAAAWAAIRSAAYDRAMEHAKNAASVWESNPEAYFLRAKVLFHNGAAAEASSYLDIAMQLDREYVLKAAADEDFQKYSDVIDNLVKLRTRDWLSWGADTIELMLDRYNEVYSELEDSNRALWDKLEVDFSLSYLFEVVEQAKRMSSSGTYFGATDCRNHLRSLEEWYYTTMDIIEMKLELVHMEYNKFDPKRAQGNKVVPLVLSLIFPGIIVSISIFGFIDGNFWNPLLFLIIGGAFSYGVAYIVYHVAMYVSTKSEQSARGRDKSNILDRIRQLRRFSKNCKEAPPLTSGMPAFTPI